MRTQIGLRIPILDNADAVANGAAKLIAAEARAAAAARGHFVMAAGGGHTPWQMLPTLANEAVPWEVVHVVRVDERIAPADVSSPAGRIRQEQALAIVDRAAAGEEILKRMSPSVRSADRLGENP